MRGIKREAAEMRKNVDGSTPTSPTKKRKADGQCIPLLMPTMTASDKLMPDDEGIGEEPKRVTRKSTANGKGKKNSKEAASKVEEENVVAKDEDSE